MIKMEANKVFANRYMKTGVMCIREIEATHVCCSSIVFARFTLENTKFD